MALFWLATLRVLASSVPSEVYHTEHGPVFGELLTTGVRAMRSIPFAAAPVGDKRWRPPSQPAPWITPRDTRPFPEMCPQVAEVGIQGSEDCLFLYVYTTSPPPTNDTAPLQPVLIFLHGGGLQEGDGYLKYDGRPGGYFDGSDLALGYDVVVVSVQYRLGALGFLALPHAADGDDTGLGNFGLLDQRFAMAWVQKNIASFGGNRSQVLLFGESAGAISVCFHIASPRSAGLFQHALMESGSCEMQVQLANLGEQFARSFAKFQVPGCAWVNWTTPLEIVRTYCLLGASVIDLVLPNLIEPRSPYDAAPVYSWCMTVDDLDLVGGSSLDMLRNRPANAQTVVFGFNKNEFQYSCNAAYGDALATCDFVDILPDILPISSRGVPPFDDGDILMILHHFTGVNPEVLEPLLDLYPIEEYAFSSVARLSAMLTDSHPARGLASLGYGGWIGACSSLKAARIVANVSVDTRVSVYNFTRSGSWPTTSHFAEIPYIFQRCQDYDGICQGAPANSMEESLAAAMGAYWTGIARGVNANSSAIWPDFGRTELVLHLDIPIEVGPVPAQQSHRCLTWARILEAQSDARSVEISARLTPLLQKGRQPATQVEIQ